jgi:hypothetical protein
MLKDEREIYEVDFVSALIAETNGLSAVPKKIQSGIYEIGHFGGSHFLPGYGQDAELSVNSYGVCDTAKQLLAACPELESDSSRHFVVTLTPLHREKQSKQGGWRWHKWGPYIGTQNPQHEYLYDEENIDLVYVYQIYEKNP